MDNIFKKLLSDSSLPLLTDEAMKTAIKMFAHNRTAMPSTMQLSGYVPPKEEPVYMDKNQEFGYEILAPILEKINEDVTHEGLDEYEKNIIKKRRFLVQGYGVFVPIKRDVYLFLSRLGKMSAGQIWEECEFARVIFDTNARFTEIIGSINTLPFVSPRCLPHKYPYDYCIYFNAPYGETRCRFVTEYIKKCTGRRIPHYMECFKGDIEGNMESCRFYVYQEFLIDVLEILEEIKQEMPELVSTMGTPIVGGLNYANYFTLGHSGRRKTDSSFSEIVQYCMSWAFAITCARYIKETRFDTLSEKDKSYLVKYLDFDCVDFVGKCHTDGIGVFHCSSFEIYDFFTPEELEKFADDPKFVLDFRDNYLTIQSLYNFKDTKHKNIPPCFNQQFFDYYGYDAKDFEFEWKK